MTETSYKISHVNASDALLVTCINTVFSGKLNISNFAAEYSVLLLIILKNLGELR